MKYCVKCPLLQVLKEKKAFRGTLNTGIPRKTTGGSHVHVYGEEKKKEVHGSLRGDDRSMLLHDKRLLEEFEVRSGVRQGCKL